MLNTKDRVDLELDGISYKWESTSDIGKQVTNGESGISPTTGKIVKTAGTSENRALTLTKIYDPAKDKDFVNLLLDESPTAVLRSGKTKATLLYYGDAGAIDSKFILSGLNISSYQLPGKNGLEKGWSKLVVEFEVGEVLQA